MLPVIYSMSVSLDGFIAGPGDDISWGAPDAEQFDFHVEQTRHVAAHLCGRSLYEEMLVWETAEQTMSGEAELEFARIWRAIPSLPRTTAPTCARPSATSSSSATCWKRATRSRRRPRMSS